MWALALRISMFPANGKEKTEMVAKVFCQKKNRE
jgi:hypothetical protein